MMGTEAKCQGRYCKNQVVLNLLYDCHCSIERNTNHFPLRNKKKEILLWIIFFDFVCLHYQVESLSTQVVI